MELKIPTKSGKNNLACTNEFRNNQRSQIF